MVYPPTHPDPWMSFCNCSFVWRHLNHWLASPSMFTCPLILLKHFWLVLLFSMTQLESERPCLCSTTRAHCYTSATHMLLQQTEWISISSPLSQCERKSQSQKSPVLLRLLYFLHLMKHGRPSIGQEIDFQAFFYKQPLLLRGGAVEVVKAAGYFPSPSPGCDQTEFFTAAAPVWASVTGRKL